MRNINQIFIFLRVVKGIATDAETERVQRMISRSRMTFDELKRLNDAVCIQDQIEELESCDTATAFGRLLQTIRKREKRRLIFFYTSRAAAILFIPLLLSAGILTHLLLSRPVKRDTVYVEIVSPAGSMTRFELPDQSRIWLNAGSTLRYPNPFGADGYRRVELHGEGYFEVQADPDHPFCVTAPDGISILARGTKFGIRTGEHTIETVLAEGCVAVYKTDRLLANLHVGEQATYDKRSDKLQIDPIHLYEKLAWKDGIIYFRDAPLEEVFERLERQYNVDIVIHDPHRQSNRYRSRVTFAGETIEQIMTYLQAAAPIEWAISQPTRNEDTTLTRQRIDVTLKQKSSNP